MRQFLVVVILVGAAFMGGAFVNGPGLQWAQTKMLRSLGLNNGGEITSLNLEPVAGMDTSRDESGLIKPQREIVEGPIAPSPSLLTENDSSGTNTRVGHSLPADNQHKPKIEESRLPEGQTSSSLAPVQQPPTLSEAPTLESPAADPKVERAGSTSRPGITHSEPKAAPAILDTLAALLPPTPPSSTESPAPPRRIPAQKAITDGNEDWLVLERKMQSLGVSRYTMEGEPGGRVTFTCLIPLAGRQAVTQRFEAEGDDFVQAARATLRRIALWRATQSSSQ